MKFSHKKHITILLTSNNPPLFTLKLRYTQSSSLTSNCAKNGKINPQHHGHKAAAEQTSEPILPSQPSGNFHVDESVKACEVGLSYIAWASLRTSSFSCPRNKDGTCAELWHVAVGPDRKKSSSNYRPEKRRTTLSKLNYLAAKGYAKADANQSLRWFRWVPQGSICVRANLSL